MHKRVAIALIVIGLLGVLLSILSMNNFLKKLLSSPNPSTQIKSVDTSRFIPNQLLITFKAGTTMGEIKAQLVNSDIRELSIYSPPGRRDMDLADDERVQGDDIFLAKFIDQKGKEAALMEELQNIPIVADVSYNYVSAADFLPDPAGL